MLWFKPDGSPKSNLWLSIWNGFNGLTIGKGRSNGLFCEKAEKLKRRHRKIKPFFIMALLLKIFPYANAEIVTAAVTCFFMTLFGLSLGFALLKIQGE